MCSNSITPNVPQSSAPTDASPSSPTHCKRHNMPLHFAPQRQCHSESGGRDGGHLGSENPSPDARRAGIPSRWSEGRLAVSPRVSFESLQSSLVVRVQAAAPALHAISPRQDSALGCENRTVGTRFPCTAPSSSLDQKFTPSPLGGASIRISIFTSLRIFAKGPPPRDVFPGHDRRAR